MAEELESWDSDPDFLIPNSGLSLPLSSNSPSTPSSPLPLHQDSPPDFFSLLDSKLHEPISEAGRNEKEDSLDSLKSTTSTESTVSTTGTIKGLMEGLSLDHGEDEATISFNEEVGEEREQPKSKMQTLRLGSDLSKLLAETKMGSGRGKVVHLGSTPFGKAVDVGEGDWDQDLDFGEDEEGGGFDALGLKRGEEDHSRRALKNRMSWTSHISLGEEDDFEGEGPQLSLKSNEARPTLKEKISIDSFQDDPESEEISDLDFDLPSSQSTFEISPSLALNRPSMSSLRSHSTSDSQHPPRESSSDSISSVKTATISSIRAPPPLSLATAPSRLSVISMHSTSASATTTDDDDSDAEFFQDLELPSYFLGGSSTESNSSPNDRRRNGGATTPPTSEGEMDAFFSENSPSPKKEDGGKIDLQTLLKRKLELRGGRGLLFGTTNSTSPTKEQLEGLEKHRETDEEELETGRELSLSQSREEVKQEESWNAEEMRERMRTISGARAKEAQMARNSRNGVAGRANGGMRRTMSMGGGKLPTLPTGANKRPSIIKRSDTTPDVTRGVAKTGLSRSGSSASVTHLPSISSRSSLPHVVRPTSAQSSHSTSTTASQSSRKGPPPAPSTASRDRIRMRTISLRTIGSTSDLRNASTASHLTRRPSRLNLDQSSDDRTLSPVSVPLTPVQTPSHPPRAASSPGPTPSLRPKRSQQHLRPSLTPSGPRAIERKRSLQNLSSTDQHPPPSSASRPSSRQTSLRSPSPARSHHTPSSRPSFAAPTASSASRVRERVNSNPHPLHPTIVPASANPSFSSTRSSTTIARLLQPTLSSASKTRSPTKPIPTPTRSHPPLSGVRIPPQSLQLSRPTSSNRKRTQDEAYGDGTELDGFDDLPVSKEREKALIVHAKGRSVSRASAADSRKSSTGSGVGGEGKGVGKVVRSLLPVVSKGLMGKKEGEKAREKEKDKGKKKRREPHLIRHLGGAQGVPKVHGEMTYNPTLQRWEGNESILREFDKVLFTSTRPALISPFSSTLGSPARSGFSSPTLLPSDSITPHLDPIPVAQPLKPQPASRGGVKVVGDMVFDPATCSWHALSGPEAEDELDLDWGEVADDEEGGEGDGWEKGERERMLKNRASFVLSEGEEGSSEEEGKKGKMTKRGIWRESKRAEERCKEEMKDWIVTEEEGKEEDRSWLFGLRALIMDSQ
ncbi:hypothetical protein JCM5353_002153 [Sporobolomyces roseus]